MRSVAEVLRRLALAGEYDEEAMDMTAYLVYTLREIGETIESSAQAWDDRNYWKKAEALREKWRWAPKTADRLERLVINDRWELVPDVLIELLPHVQHIRIQQITRDADWWCGALRALKSKHRG
jgi:hypothetical protein